MVAVAVCLVGVACLHDLAAKEPVNDLEAIEGLWSGGWGHVVDANGVVHQAAMAELFIKGNHAELYGFPKMGENRLTGIVRFDASAKQMQITPAVEADSQPAKSIVYAYEIKADELLLIDRDKFRIALQRHRVAQKPLANAQVDLVVATGIDAAGDLLVTEFSMLQAGRAGAAYFEPMDWSRKTKQATVLLVQEAGCKQVTLAEARRQIREPTLVAIAYRHDDRREWQQLHRLWKDIGPPTPDSEAVWQTFSQILRPGTLVFILSARENVLQP